MSIPPTVIVLVSFVAVSGGVLAVALIVRDLRRPDERLDRRLGLSPERLQDTSAAAIEPPATGRIDRAFRALIETSGTNLTPQTALALVVGLAVVGCAVPLVLLENLLAGAAGLLLGSCLPLVWWSIRRARRLAAMRRHLPETLELLADAVRAGQTLERAAESVAAEAPAPLGEEFGYSVAQLKLGHSPVAVMQRMARRIPLPEFKIFSTAVLVHRQTGGNLALLAQRLANSARDRYELRGHVSAVTAASRFSVIGLILGTLIAVGILAWVRPEYLDTFRSHRLGPTLLVAAAVLQIVGIVCVWRIVRVRQ